MAPARRQSNGRSPLVNKQSQITSFFNKPPAAASTASSVPSPPQKETHSKENPKPSPSPSPNARCSTGTGTGTGTGTSTSPGGSASPTTPSPLQPKRKKPLLVIPSGGCRHASMKSRGSEVSGKRVRVYWPLDEAWYEGCVKEYNEESGRHVVVYDDGEEEALELAKEKVEWVEEGERRLKRLRRGGGGEVEIKSAGVDDRVVDEDEVEEEGGGDDEEDEDWGMGKVVGEDGEDDYDDAELVDDDDSGLAVGRASGRLRSRKRKGAKDSGKKWDTDSRSEGKTEVLALNPIIAKGSKFKAEKTGDVGCSSLPVDSSERFSIREAEKFPFLGQDRRDANKRRPGDADYDLKSLYLPPNFLKGLTGGQRQWWEFKSKHMDKVLFFKMGKFYELFEMDAHVGAKELDLQYMKGDQPHCGFPERNYSMNVEKLARKGYRVLVIEQTETPEQLEIRRKEHGSKDRVVKREICSLITKGTLTDGEMLLAHPEASYLMAVTAKYSGSESSKTEPCFGVCIVDAATSKITLGQFNDGSECRVFCRLLSELRPVEIVKPAKLLSAEAEKAILSHTRNPLVNELKPIVEFWDAGKTIQELKILYECMDDRLASGSPEQTHEKKFCSPVLGDSLKNFPSVLSGLINSGDDGDVALSALGGAIYYLRQAFLDETLLRFGNFELLPSGDIGNNPQYLMLDAAALENLEIFENSRNGGSSGTLYAQLDHCVTACGKRLLRSWLARPLYNLELIKQRQDAIADLRGEILPSILEFRKAMSKVPDLERLLARIFSCSEACGRNANKVILYEDAAKKQLHEFISALRGCKSIHETFSSLSAVTKNIRSRLLNHLMTPGEGLPEVNSVLKHFKDAFDWVEAGNSGRITPREGVDVEYDSACNAVKQVESSLTKYLKEQKQLLGDKSIKYVTIGKDAYLIEVPESLQGSVPRDYELSSSKKGFFRYYTPRVKKLLSELSQAEYEKESALKSILQRLIRQFSSHQSKWRQLISATAELDVLASLAIASDYYEGPTCRPKFISSGKFPCLSAKSLGHPLLRSDTLGKGAFVPNDVNIGGSASAKFILLTGPNMGGKSTLLRQVCLAVILAHVGADVPAESLDLSPVDRIFVRMGAKDHIMAGQSTFLNELSETASMLSAATSDSLVVLDELGRGTSTSDGQAIAEAVLHHFVHSVQCRGMFSTHYHHLAVKCSNDPGVSLCHMACQVGAGGDVTEEVTFLYRLTQGACPKSYGVNVARLAGIPESILLRAAVKSREFEESYGRNKRQPRKNSHVGNQDDWILPFLQELIRAAERPDASVTSAAADSLHRLQEEVRAILLPH
ncbi:hypothetical protein MLD38_026357 [Melastoma candidum]|uniref:Uncharacterized protein n=1 Tax=Melastoma candidum TaxID=119954 RepID=A0ACB9NYU3_9MYRT|nr:hypothetical protein MLD38_026357 [Melastoma candidum]